LKEKIEKRIKDLQERYKDLGEYRKSCANLGRGVTDSILEDMNQVQSQINELQNLLDD
jgi:hypothetical protein